MSVCHFSVALKLRKGKFARNIFVQIITPSVLCVVLWGGSWTTSCGFPLLLLLLLFLLLLTKHHYHSTPAGAESDSNPTAAAPSQKEVTDLNCSDHSTTSKEMAAWRALVSLQLTRIQDPTYDTLWCDCSTAAYDHSDPEEIAQIRQERRKTVREGWVLISTIERSKSRGEL